MGWQDFGMGLRLYFVDILGIKKMMFYFLITSSGGGGVLFLTCYMYIPIVAIYFSKTTVVSNCEIWYRYR